MIDFIQQFFTAIINLVLMLLDWIFNFFQSVVSLFSDTITHINTVVGITSEGMGAIRSVIMYIPSPIYTVVFGAIVIIMCLAIIKVVT